MSNNHILLGACLVFSIGLSASPKWQTQIEHDINIGNLINAESTIDSVVSRSHGKYNYQADSLKAVIFRIRNDFSLTPQEGKRKIKERLANIDDKTIDTWKSKKYIETMIIDGKEMWFRKSVSNLWLLCPELKSQNTKCDDDKYLETINSIESSKIDKNHCSNWQHVLAKFTLTVAPNATKDGEYIKAWLPVPINTVRQKNFKLLSSTDAAIESKNSAHHTIQLSKKAKLNECTKFEITFSYDVAAQYFPRNYILSNLRPYKKNELYKTYTSSDGKQIIITPRLKRLADSIIGKEKNPVLQAAKIYDWISSSFPWAGARDYGTIPNIPEYVINQGHGDCGQVSLLYITLVRAIGIPARWESGWMIHPWEKNYHDWTETYFEGIGWVPTDVSFGRRENSIINNYFKTGTDFYRMATNSNYGEPLYPHKKYIRTEPLDFQAGEVECDGGNIEGTNFNSSLSIISITPIKY